MGIALLVYLELVFDLKNWFKMKTFAWSIIIWLSALTILVNMLCLFC